MECVKLFKKGDQFQPKQFIETNADKLTRRSNNKINACQFTVSKGIKIGRELGLLKYVETKPISFIDFSNLESKQYFANQLRGGKYKNLGSKKHKKTTLQEGIIFYNYTTLTTGYMARPSSLQLQDRLMLMFSKEKKQRLLYKE